MSLPCGHLCYVKIVYFIVREFSGHTFFSRGFQYGLLNNVRHFGQVHHMAVPLYIHSCRQSERGQVTRIPLVAVIYAPSEQTLQ